MREEDWELRQTKTHSISFLVCPAWFLCFFLSTYLSINPSPSVSHSEFRKFRSVALADVTVVPLRARNFRYFYSITPAGGRLGPSRGISIEFQTIFKLRLIWLVTGGYMREREKERGREKKREGKSRQLARVCSQRRSSCAVRGWFEAGGEIYGFYYRPYGSLKRHDIYKQSIVCFARTAARGKTEVRRNHVSPVRK